MATSSTGENAGETRLNEILAAYLQAVQRGEAPDRQSLMAEHPEYADDLASFFADQDRFKQAAAPIRFAAGAVEPTLAGSTSPELPTGQRVRYFGDYEVIEEIARGGMGVVYRARQVNLKRIVALKMVLAGQLATPQEIQRFYAEAEAAAKLAHPNIVPIFEVGQHEQQHYFSMAFVDGESLARRIAQGVFEPRDAARLMKDVASAIAYAHVEGVIHRDLKPGNILIDHDGTPRVTDFGLAKRVEGEANGLTVTGQVLGTPSYMPPEQASGDSARITQLSDVYALGAVLYCLVTGRPPFQAASTVETLIQVLEQEPVSPRQLNTAVPLDLETIILKCLEKEPSRRYSSAQHLVDELARFLDGRPIIARPVSAAERGWRWCRRNPVVAGLAAAVVMLLAAGTGVSAYFAFEARAQARDALAEKHRADDNALTANDKAREALDNAEQARKESNRADAKTKEARRQLYAAHMNLAQSAWEDTRAAETVRLLDLYRPGAGAAGGSDDLRGFEWYYWQRLIHSNRITLKGHTSIVYSVAFSRDGQRLASSSADKTIKVWDAATGQESFTLQGHTGPVARVAFSPDGSRLASASHDKTVKLWDVATRDELLTLNGHNGMVMGVAFSPDGQRLASSSLEDLTVKVWDTATGQESLTLKGGGMSVAFSPDGQRLAAAGVLDVKVWDPATGQESFTLKGHTGMVTSVAFSPDGKRLASASWDKTAKIWDAVTGKELFTLKGHNGTVTNVAFSPDGQWLASSSATQANPLDPGEVKMWDAVTGQESRTLKGHSAGVNSVTFSKDGLLASASNDATVKLWDAATGQESLTMKGGGLSVAFSPDGQRLASASLILNKPGEVDVWDAATGQESLTLKGHTRQITSLAFSTNGRLASAGVNLSKPGDLGEVKLWDVVTGQESLTLKGHNGMVTSVAFSPDGQWLAAASVNLSKPAEPGEVKLWNAVTGQESRTLKGHGAGEVTSVAFSPDGKRLASASGDQTVKVWDVSTGQALLTLKGHTGAVQSVAFSRDGTRLASASQDQTVKIWDVVTGSESRTLKGHTGWVSSVAFVPDGQRLASASYDTTVKVWDTATGQEMLTLKGHTSIVTSLAISPDGQRLASSSLDGTVKVWDATREAGTSQTETMPQPMVQ